MFILSLNRKRLLKFAAAAAIISIIVISCVAVTNCRRTPPDSVSVKGAGDFSTLAETPGQEESFLQSFGLSPVSDSRDCEEVKIPRSFSKAYESYNRLQRKTGFDLSRYKGRRAKKIQYKLSDSRFTATILTIDGRVVAAHLSSGVYKQPYKAINNGKTG